MTSANLRNLIDNDVDVYTETGASIHPACWTVDESEPLSIVNRDNGEGVVTDVWYPLSMI